MWSVLVVLIAFSSPYNTALMCVFSDCVIWSRVTPDLRCWKSQQACGTFSWPWLSEKAIKKTPQLLERSRKCMHQWPMTQHVTQTLLWYQTSQHHYGYVMRCKPSSLSLFSQSWWRNCTAWILGGRSCSRRDSLGSESPRSAVPIHCSHLSNPLLCVPLSGYV